MHNYISHYLFSSISFFFLFLFLQKLLNLKLKELRRLEGEESRLLRGGSQLTSLYAQVNEGSVCSTPTLLSRLSALRQSALSHSSTHSSVSSDWDVYSEITSPVSLEDVRVNQFAYNSSLSDVSNVSSAQGSSGSVSISLSSDSQSEHKFEEAGDLRYGSTANENTGKDAFRRSKLSSNGQEDESELDISISTGQDDGDTDSQTSFSLSESPKISSLSEIMAREESNRLPETSSSLDEENFRQMYTVARWVGMNTGIVRRRSLSGSVDIVLGNELSGPSKTRVLGSVKETGEEGTISDIDSKESDLAKVSEGEEYAEDKSSNTTTPIATGSRLQMTLQHNFYIESDSEESSVMSGHTGRGRRDTVIEVRDFETPNGHSDTDPNSSGCKFPTPVKEATTNASSSTASNGRILNTSHNGTSNVDLRFTVEQVAEVNDNSTSSHIPPFHSSSERVGQSPNHQSVSLQSNLSVREPRYVQGVLVNDQTYLTRL